ncbi:MAG: hypothetical protein ACLUDU_14780 [Butyricimonas faecihominis]
MPSYADRLLKVNNMQSYYDMKVLYMGKKEEALAQLERDDLTETERKKWESEVNFANNVIAAMDKQLIVMTSIKHVEQNCPENSGLLAWLHINPMEKLIIMS